MKIGVMILAAALLALGGGCKSGPDARGETGSDSAAITAEGEKREEAAPAPRSQSKEVNWEAAREQSERVSESDMEAFARGVRALAEREKLLLEEGRDMESRSRRAGSPIEVVQIREETLAEMVEALDEVGLEFESFLQAGQMIRSNPVLMERLGKHLEKEEIERFFGELGPEGSQ